MNPGLRTYKKASCRIAVAEALPDEMKWATREIVSVKSENPRKGHARALMFEVCEEANRDWITLILHVRPFSDGMTLDQLIKWYSKFNFVVIQESPCLMVRSPCRPTTIRKLKS